MQNIIETHIFTLRIKHTDKNKEREGKDCDGLSTRHKIQIYKPLQGCICRRLEKLDKQDGIFDQPQPTMAL